MEKNYLNFGINSMEQGPEGGRNLNSYERILNFKKEDLEGKVILDLGAGPGARFSEELKQSGVNADVFSLSPDYADDKHREQFQLKLTEKLRSIFKNDIKEKPIAVAGIGEDLPFRDESFDEVLALFSVSVWSLSNYEKWLPEVVRVLKTNGVARIGVFHAPKMDMYSGDIEFKSRQRMKDFVEKIRYKHEFIPGPEVGQEVLLIFKNLIGQEELEPKKSTEVNI